METGDLYDLFRKQVQDRAQPYLFDAVEVYQYLDDAQKMFVRLTGGISDMSTRSVTDIAVVSGQPTSKHSKLILRIRSARLITAQRELDIISEADLGTKMVQDYGWVPGTFLDDEDEGDVVAAIIGLEDKKLRWFRVPETDDTCRMHVYRLPLDTVEDDSCDLEIDEQHHIALIMHMKYLAYSKEDAETYDKNLAERNKEAFRAYCDEAKAELERVRYKPRVIRMNPNW